MSRNKGNSSASTVATRSRDADTGSDSESAVGPSSSRTPKVVERTNEGTREIKPTRPAATVESAELPSARKAWTEIKKEDGEAFTKLITSMGKSPVFKDVSVLKLEQRSTLYVKFAKEGSSEPIAWGAGTTARAAGVECRDGIEKFINNNKKDESPELITIRGFFSEAY